MSIVLVFVHGWSVTSKDTYGELPEAIAQEAAAAGVQVELRDIYLGRYISFHDEVTVDDIAVAMEHAVRTDLKGVAEFSCVTHSTGGPVVRRWVDRFYGPDRVDECPLRHLIMLAPANHGSALAILGKARVGRIQAWFGGVEPGQRVLDWLCLGSPEAWQLQDSFTGYSLDDTTFFPFVLSGETIDKKFYDFVNSYLGEVGSDGVVRLAGANLNYTLIRLEQTAERYDEEDDTGYILQVRPRTKPRPPVTGFGVVPKASHSGGEIGIMRSVTPRNTASKPVVDEIVKCLTVKTRADYATRLSELDALTAATQKSNAEQYGGKERHFVMLIFRIRDDRGQTVGDYDLLLLGDGFEADKLPRGFFVDRQRNPRSQALTYYLDYDVLTEANDLGIRVNARPMYSEPGESTPEAFAGYRSAEFRFTGRRLKQLVRPNETVYVDIVLNRVVDVETIRLEPLEGSNRGSFKKTKPKGPVA
jgi:hypothetical protein